MSCTCCAICGVPLALSAPCRQAHPDHCHECHRRNLASGYDAQEHPAPGATLTLSPRDVQALLAYQQRVQRLREEER
jgi:hypothetical protein